MAISHHGVYIAILHFVTMWCLRINMYFEADGSRCTVSCLCVMPRIQGLAEGQWAERTTSDRVLCVCVTVGEYHDIKQYHSGLCALTQGTLCTFLQGWGKQGEAVQGGLVGGLHAFCPAIAVLQVSVSLGKSYNSEGQCMKTIVGYGTK